MRCNLILLFLSLIPFFSQASEIKSDDFFPLIEISGEITESIINRGRPYLVTADIKIPAGITVSIDSGVVFLFKNFTGIQIMGTLLSRGTKENPIIYTSENDRQYNTDASMDAAPFDWNGITIYESGLGSSFEWCSINYSLFGINALTDIVTLRSCLFFQNGKSDFSLVGKKMSVGQSYYSYEFVKEDALKKGITVNIVDESGIRKTILRYSGLSFMAIGASVGVWKGLSTFDNFKKYEDLRTQPPGEQFDGISSSEKAILIEQYRKNFYTDLTISLASATALLLGSVGFTISF